MPASISTTSSQATGVSHIVHALRSPIHSYIDLPSAGQHVVEENALFCSDTESVAAPPDGGYGWVCAACSLVLNAVSWGPAAGFGVYLNYFLSHNTFPDMTRLDFCLLFGSVIGMAVGVAPAVHVAVSKVGFRVVLGIGVIFETAGYIGVSFATAKWQLFLLMTLVVGIGAGCLYIPATLVIPQWFVRRRSLANGIAAAGTGVGGVAFALAADATIRAASVAWAFRMTAFAVFGFGSVAAFLLKSRDSVTTPGLRVFRPAVLMNASLITIMIWAVVSLFGFVVVLFSLQSFAATVGDLSFQRASAITAILNAAQAVGRPGVGYACDKFGRLNITYLATLLNGVLVLGMWLWVRSFGAILVFALCIGIVLGIVWSSFAALTADASGLADFPGAFSFVCLGCMSATTFGQAVGYRLQDKSMSNPFLPAQLFAGLCFIVGSSVLLGTRELKVRHVLTERRAVLVEDPEKSKDEIEEEGFDSEAQRHLRELENVEALLQSGIRAYFARMFTPMII